MRNPIGFRQQFAIVRGRLSCQRSFPPVVILELANSLVRRVLIS